MSVRLHKVDGYAGSGKSITLRRVAWEAAVEHSKLVMWLNKGGLLRVELIDEICEITGERVFLFVEDALDYLRELERLIENARQKKQKLTVVFGARTNEWNVVSPSFESQINSEYELRDLSDRETIDLLEKLEAASCLGALERVPSENRKEHFVLTSQRQLLVALHEATFGKSFEEIVLDEYRNIQPDEAKALYLDVCTLHRFGVGVRAGLISRISGVSFTRFKDKLLGPLEHVVEIFHDAYSRDFAYRSRHTLVSDLVFRGVFDDPEDRANQIVRVVSSMNVDYESDRKAFSELVRGRELAVLFSDRVLADRVFEAALNSGADRSHIEHQKAVFEMNHPGGSYIRADRSLDEAEKHANTNSSDAIFHTRATLLRAKANQSNNDLEKQKYRSDAEGLLAKLIRKRKNSHPIHTLGQIYLDELKERSENITDQTLAGLITRIEKVLEDGHANYPGDTYLLGLEASIANELNDSPRAQEVLSEAIKKNPHDQHMAIRLSRIMKKRGDIDGAKSVLSDCIQKTPTARRAKYQLAILLINEGSQEANKEISSLLRSAFSDGDTNYDAQFWFARHEYIFGNREVSAKYFQTLSENAPNIRKVTNLNRSSIKGENGEIKRYTASIKNIRDTFCFVHIREINDDIFIHRSECDDATWVSLKVGDTVSISIQFSFKGPRGFEMRAES